MDQFNDAHDETEICLIQIDYVDSFNSARVGFYGVQAWPTIAGNGITDVWPVDCIEGDLAAYSAVPSPLTITISEQGEGMFTAHITAEEDVINASFFMVATLDEYVPASGGGMSHLPHHVKEFLTPPSSGDPFTLMAGESVDISHSFTVAPEWDYDMMGVAAWVSRPGGTDISPCTYGSLNNRNEVLQSRWVPANSDMTNVENQDASPQGDRYMLSSAPNPFNPKTTVSYVLPQAATVSLQVFDLSGRLVDELAVGESQAAGHHSVEWDGRDQSGRQLSSGVYLCQLKAGKDMEMMRMVLIK